MWTSWLWTSWPWITLALDPLALAERFAATVERRLEVPAEERDHYAAMVNARYGEVLRREPAQYLLVVDRDPLVQAILVMFRAPDGAVQWIGAAPVSTGKPGGFEYFVTPEGLFRHSLENLDFRAEGTKNQNGIRGYGAKGMRVFDFGWVKALKTWGTGGESLMRLQMHATDPDLLEPRLGAPLSKGCIRIPAALNEFLDRYGVIDAAYDAALRQGRSFFVLRADREPVEGAGQYLAVVDSRRTERPAWSPKPRDR